MWAGRDYDLYIERTAWIVPTILGVVDGVSSTLIHLTTGPDGYEALVWRRGNRAGPRRLIFESSTWKLTGPSSRVITTSAERKSRSFPSTTSPWRPFDTLTCSEHAEFASKWARFVLVARLVTDAEGGAREKFQCMTGRPKRALSAQ